MCGVSPLGESRHKTLLMCLLPQGHSLSATRCRSSRPQASEERAGEYHGEEPQHLNREY